MTVNYWFSEPQFFHMQNGDIIITGPRENTKEIMDMNVTFNSKALYKSNYATDFSICKHLICLLKTNYEI